MSAGARIAANLNAWAEARGWSLRCYADVAFDHPELGGLHAVWSERAKGGVPPRGLFDARSLKPYLRHISILERVEEGYLYRLYGSALVQVMGEQTGRYLHDVIPADRLERWTTAYNAVLEAGEPLRFISRFQIPQLSYYDGESLSAPVRGKNGEVNTILSATYFTVKEHLQVRTG